LIYPDHATRYLNSQALVRRSCVSSTDHDGRQFWVVAAEREDGGRFIVRADEKLSAFLELESAIRTAERPQDCGRHEIKFDKLSRIK
jgi:hypothetical protein